MSEEDFCRICRGEETPEEPLFHPCKCSGSIRYVHEKCLLGWMHHTYRNRCDLCGRPYEMRKVYKSSMPRELPVRDYAKYAVTFAFENVPYVFLAARFFIVVFAMAILVYYILEISIVIAESGRPYYEFIPCTSYQAFMILESAKTVRKRMLTQPLRESVAPYIDMIASLFIPEHELRSAAINGLVFLIVFGVVVIFSYCLSWWVISEPALLHDLDHIHEGEISHMDRGDDDELLSYLYNIEQDRINGDGVEIDEFIGNAVRAANNGEINEEIFELDGEDSDYEGPRGVFVVNEEDNRHHEHHDNNELLDNNNHDISHDSNNNSNNNEGEVDNDNHENVYDKGQREVYDERDIFEDMRLEAQVRAQLRAEERRIDPEIDDEEDFAPILGNLFLDIIVLGAKELFAMAVGILLLFILLSLCYTTVYRVYISQLTFIMEQVHQRYPQYLRSSTYTPPSSIPGRLAFLLGIDLFNLSIMRLLVLLYMDKLLKSQRGRAVIRICYQVYAVHKTLLMTAVESLVFPPICGLLLHLTLMPLVGPSWQWHWDMYQHHKYWTQFVHYVLGYGYMHSLQVFVTALRTFFRPGVLYFLHDNHSNYFMRSIMLLSLPKQLRRISISAGIYAVLIVGGCGSFAILLCAVEKHLAPIDITSWPGILPLLQLWPLQTIMGVITAKLYPSKRPLRDILTLWLRERVWIRLFDYIATQLDLGSWLLSRPRELSDHERKMIAEKKTSAGYFVRAPISVPAKTKSNATVLFVPVNENDERMDGKIGVMDNELPKYTVVWSPPNFRWRLAAMAGIVWVYISVLMVLFTVFPLYLGRVMDWIAFKGEIRNDLLHEYMGLCIILPIYALILQHTEPIELARCARFYEVKGRLPRPTISESYKAVVLGMAMSGLGLALPESWGRWMPCTLKNAYISFTVNSVLFSIGSTLSFTWNQRTNVLTFVLIQVVLEIFGVSARTPLPVTTAGILTIGLRRYLQWTDSESAKKLAAAIRKKQYLVGEHLGNYEPSTNGENGEANAVNA